MVYLLVEKGFGEYPWCKRILRGLYEEARKKRISIQELSAPEDAANSGSCVLLVCGSGEWNNHMIRRCRDKGFFVTYNHPNWSMENYAQYMGYNGMHAMEICNFGCVAVGYDDYNSVAYDDMLRGNKRIYCIATDDNHNHGDPATRRYDSFGGFTMIKADKLDYRTVTKALEDGHFYASMGPEIKALWYEDGMVHLECSPAEKIIFTVGQRRTRLIWTNEGEFVTEANFDINANDVYFRITVIDEKGRCADTNAYFYDDLNA